MLYASDYHHKTLMHPRYMDDELLDNLVNKIHHELIGKFLMEKGTIVSILGVHGIEPGIIREIDCFIVFPCNVRVLFYKIEEDQYVNAEITNLNDLGIFINVGVESFISESTLPPEMKFVNRNGEKLYKTASPEIQLKVGDVVRTKIVSVHWNNKRIVQATCVLDSNFLDIKIREIENEENLLFEKELQAVMK